MRPHTDPLAIGTSEDQLSVTAPVSWLWLLLPIILTTALVIFGAWRRAVVEGTAEER